MKGENFDAGSASTRPRRRPGSVSNAARKPPSADASPVVGSGVPLKTSTSAGRFHAALLGLTPAMARCLSSDS